MPQGLPARRQASAIRSMVSRQRGFSKSPGTPSTWLMSAGPTKSRSTSGIAAISAIPAVVIVGVLNNMYALDSQIGRRLMVSIAVFFIVFVQVTKGLTHNDATQIELMDSYAATPRQVLAKVRIPNALPFFFTAIRTAAPIAVIIALVSEYFGGTQDGLGSKISGGLNTGDKALGFAYVVGGSILGLLFFAGSNLLEYLVVPWQRRRRAG